MLPEDLPVSGAVDGQINQPFGYLPHSPQAAEPERRFGGVAFDP